LIGSHARWDEGFTKSICTICENESPLAVHLFNSFSRQRGHNQPNIPAMRSASMNPSMVAIIVVDHARRYQIDICQSAAE